MEPPSDQGKSTKKDNRTQDCLNKLSNSNYTLFAFDVKWPRMDLYGGQCEVEISPEVVVILPGDLTPSSLSLFIYIGHHPTRVVEKQAMSSNWPCLSSIEKSIISHCGKL